MLLGSAEKSPNGAVPCSGKEASAQCRWWWPRRRVWGDTSVVWRASPLPQCRHSYRRAFYSTLFSYLFFCPKLTWGEVKLKGPLKRPGHWWRGKSAPKALRRLWRAFMSSMGCSRLQGTELFPCLGSVSVSLIILCISSLLSVLLLIWAPLCQQNA